MSAVKHDGGKPRMELLPPLALQEVAKVLAFGAKKYGDFNWLNGFDYSRLIGACLRHVFAYVGGETYDPESGLHHLSHACCCLLFILELNARRIGKDDRGYPTTTKVVVDAAKEVINEQEIVLAKLGNITNHDS